MRRSGLVSLALAFVVPLGCGGSTGNASGTTDPSVTCTTTTNGTFTMTLNGQTWIACGKVSVQTASSILGKDTLNTISWAASGFLPGNVAYAIVMGASKVGQLVPGTYAVGQANPTQSNLVVGNSNNAGWGANAVSGSGTVTLTTVAANHLTGTFSFDAAPTTGTAGTLQVRNGRVDISF